MMKIILALLQIAFGNKGEKNPTQSLKNSPGSIQVSPPGRNNVQIMKNSPGAKQVIK